MPVITIRRSVALNKAYGGFALGEGATKELARLKGFELVKDQSGYWTEKESRQPVETLVSRDDEDLLTAIRCWQEEAGTKDIKIRTITITVEISSYDGKESIASSGVEEP